MKHPKPHLTPRTTSPATRITAALLSGTLALGTAPAPAALAAEADREGEGTAPPALLPASPEDDPDFDPGGTDIPLDPEPETTVDVEIEEEIETEPAAEAVPASDPAVTEPEAVVDPATDPAANQPKVPASAEPEASPTPAATAPGVGGGPAKSPVKQIGQTAPAEKAESILLPVAQSPAKQSEATGHKPTAKIASPAGTPAAPAPGEAVTETAPEPGFALTRGTGPVAAPESSALPSIRPDARIYRVQPGDSLWIIAKALLPSRATDAEIAQKVDALWRLNQDRIATGDPDLIPAGITLVVS